MLSREAQDRSTGSKQKLWLDADTGNETDDVYAIVRLLAEPDVEVVGLSSAHFNNPDLLVFEKWNQYPADGLDPVGVSQQLNEEILRLMRLESIPHPLGADRQIGRAWGGREPRPSPASTALIAAVKCLAPGERLDIIALAAVTNVASAILIDPTILPHVRCFALAAARDATSGAWNKNEFNVRNDLNAFDALLNQAGLDLTIMPTDVARPYTFQWDDVVRKIDDAVPIQRFMKDRWSETNPQDASRILWDLALVEAYLLPQHAMIETVTPPPENAQRPIRAYTHLNAAALTEDFWQSLRRLR